MLRIGGKTVEADARLLRVLLNLAGVAGSVGDHGSLSGLGADDHTQYILADGTRPLTNHWDAGDYEIESKYFDADTEYRYGGVHILSAPGMRNLFAGADAGNASVLGGDNTYVGVGTGPNTVGGSENVAVGSQALASIEEGSDNVAIGYLALESAVDADFNVAIGAGALFMLNSGELNVAIGVDALESLETGDENVAIGYIAGQLTTSGYNTFVGAYAGVSNLGGTINTAIGWQAGVEITSGDYNTCIGGEAGSDCKTGSYNTFVGYAAGATGSLTDQSGDHNVGIGYDSAASLTSGANNIFIGTSAGSAISTESNNVMIGHTAGSLAETSGSVFIGQRAGRDETNNNRLYIHNSESATPLIYGEFDTPYLEIHGDVGIHTAYGLKHDDGVSDGYVLRANGTRYVPAQLDYSDLTGSSPGVSFADPTASVGLTVVNGVATTAMRSDAAPPLDQSIAPTWTATHVFTASPGAEIFTAAGTDPVVLFQSAEYVSALLKEDSDALLKEDSNGILTETGTPIDRFAVGVDEDDSYKFKINSGGSIANPSDFELDTSGNVEIAGDFNLLTGKGVIHADGVSDGYVLRANGTRYVPAQLDYSDLTGSPPGGVTYGTPNFTLGTTNAAGSTDEVVRRDATIALFDVTTPADVTLTAATGSAGVAARRDHVHALDVGIAPTWTAAHVFRGPTQVTIDTLSGDAKLSLALVGVDKFTLGIDDSDGAKFKISAGGALTTTSLLHLSSDGSLYLAGDVTQAVDKYIATDQVRAIDSGGLKLFEDGGTEGIFVQNTGFVGIGTTSPSDLFEVARDSGFSARFSQYTNDTLGVTLQIRKARGTETSASFVANNDDLGALGFFGWYSTFYQGARIMGRVDGTPAATSVPTELIFSTVADGETILTGRVTIRSSGNLELTQHLIQAVDKYIATDRVRAIDSGGLKLFDDAGYGLFVEDGGRVGIDSTSPAAQLHIRQGSASGAIPVLRLYQADVDDEFIYFQGTTAADQTKSISTVNGDGVVTGPKDYSAAAGWAYAGMLRCSINGAEGWIPYYTVDTS